MPKFEKFSPNDEGRLLLDDPVVVGWFGGGKVEILAERADIEAGELNGDSQGYDRERKRYTHGQTLQVWFKWIYDFEPAGGDAGYEEHSSEE